MRLAGIAERLCKRVTASVISPSVSSTAASLHIARNLMGQVLLGPRVSGMRVSTECAVRS